MSIPSNLRELRHSTQQSILEGLSDDELREVSHWVRERVVLEGIQGSLVSEPHKLAIMARALLAERLEVLDPAPKLEVA